MKYLFIELLLHLLAFGLPGWGQTVGDPCETAETLGSLKQRVTGYKLADGETDLCDYLLAEGWYSMSTNVLASSETPCGTSYNWYMQGNLPLDNKVAQITVCRNDGDGNICSATKTINVKRCEEDKFVFGLIPPDGCPEAYCIESLKPSNPTDIPPDISSVKPVITAYITRPRTKNKLHFSCDINPPAGTNYFYVIEWGISSGLSWIQTIKQFDPLQYVGRVDFKMKTALTEDMLRNKNFGRLGITIACKVTAQHTEIGASSPARESSPKFYGIEVQNKTVQVSNKEETTIFLRMTAPFGCPDSQQGLCSLDLNVFIPRSSHGCNIPDLTQIKGVRNRCGLTVGNDQINEWLPLRITAFDGETRLQVRKSFQLILSTHKTVPFQEIFGNYFVDPITVDVQTDMTLLKGKRCYSHNDPHMLSFDGFPYENQNSGVFVLYRNTKYKTQVQMQTTECRTNIWCNCGVAVNAGRDVFIVNNCGNGNKQKWDIRFRMCKDAILRRSVKRISSTKFEVLLPTGTLVTVTLYGTLLNVDISPGLSDYEHTEGLCGKFDGKTSNDRDKRPGSTEADPNKSWRVKPTENLFDYHNDANLETWQKDSFLCTCNADTSSTDVVNLVTCHPDLSKTCKNNRATTIYGHTCSLKARKKRNVHGIYVAKEVDVHQSVETNFVSKRNIHHKQYFPQLVSKRKVYDHDSAKVDCLDIFNTTAFLQCSSIPGIGINSFIENCIQDAQLTNSMDWSITHLEAIKDKCIHEVKVNQPLPEEDLADLKIIVNNTVINTNTTTNKSAELPIIPSFSAKLLQDIEEASCPNECNGKGKCDKGTCVCNGKYIGDDCSVDSTLPPVMEGIPDRGECDLQFRACERTSIFGTNFAETLDLSCQLAPFHIGSNFETVTNDKVLMAKAELQTFVEVSCPLQQSREKRSTESGQRDYVAYGYAISVSNDGINYSEEDILVIFDSECVNCTKDNGKVICRQNPGYCVKKGQCYRYGETNGCNVCVGGTDNLLNWEAGPDCPFAVNDSEQPRRLWIIPATVCPVIVLVLVIVGLLCYQSKRAKAKKGRRVIDSIHDTRPGSTSNNRSLNRAKP